VFSCRAGKLPNSAGKASAVFPHGSCLLTVYCYSARVQLRRKRWFAVITALLFIGVMLACFPACPDHGDEDGCAPTPCGDCVCHSLALPASANPIPSADRRVVWAIREPAFHPLLMPNAIFQPPRA